MNDITISLLSPVPTQWNWTFREDAEFSKARRKDPMHLYYTFCTTSTN